MEKFLESILGSDLEGTDQDDRDVFTSTSEDVNEIEQLSQYFREVGVLRFVEALGPYLTSDNPIPRVKSTAILCLVLQNLSDESSLLTTPQAQTMLFFFLNRYESDWESALACLRGIQAILKRESLNKTELFADPSLSEKILRSVLSTHFVPDLSQPLRAMVYEIVKVMITEYSEFIHQTPENPWFSSIFRDAMDGEKDPRCLVVSLALLAIILKNARLGGEDFVEDAFDITSVYFPITFRPPPNDPFGITTEDLVNALNSVFCSVPRMAHCTLPMALEKIQMTSTEAGPARIEGMKLITTCAKEFEAVTLAPFLSELRDVIVGLVLSPEEEELVEAALNALKAIVRRLSPRAQVDEKDQLWDEFTLVTLRRCGMALEASIDSMAASGAAKILVAISQSCLVGFSTVLKGLVPLLQSYLQDKSDNLMKTIAAMELVRNMARCINTEIAHIPGEAPIDPYAVSLCEMVMAQLSKITTSAKFLDSEDEVRLILSCCFAMKDLFCRPRHSNPDLLPLQEQLVSHLITNVLQPVIVASKINRDLFGAVLVTVRDIDAKFNTSALNDKLVPNLLTQLKITINEKEPQDKLETLLSSFPMLCKANNPSLCQRIVVTLSEELDLSVTASALSRIARGISNEDLLEQCFYSKPWLNPDILLVLSERCSSELNEKLVRAALENLRSSMTQNVMISPNDEASLLGMRRDLTFVLPEIVQILQTYPNVVRQDSFLRIIGCAVNKAPGGETFDAHMQTLFSLSDSLSQADCIKLFGRTCKALALRSSTKYADRMGVFLQSFLHSEDEQLASASALAFGGLVSSQSNDGLDVPFARSQGVARQRTFEKWFKLLLEDLNVSPKSEGPILTACSLLAAGASRSILESSLNQVIVVMVRASKSENSLANSAAVKILKTLLTEETSGDVISSHLATLIPFLLKLTISKTSVEDKITALQILERIPKSLPYHHLHPFRSQISHHLAKGALDDERKIVRLNAVKCKESWTTFSG